MDTTNMTKETIIYQTFLGFDVGKESIAVHDGATGKRHVLANNTKER